MALVSSTTDAVEWAKSFAKCKPVQTRRDAVGHDLAVGMFRATRLAKTRLGHTDFSSSPTCNKSDRQTRGPTGYY